MKYFTPELYLLGQADDEETAVAADRLWEEANARYEQRLAEISQDLPENVRAFNELLLHDAQVVSLSRRGEQFVMVLHKDIPPRDLVTITYTLVGEPVVNQKALPGERGPVMEFLYDELDAIEEGGQEIFTHSMLFSNGWEVQLRFRDLQFALAEPIYPIPTAAPAAAPVSA